MVGLIFSTGVGVDHTFTAFAGEGGRDLLGRDVGWLLLMVLWSVGGIVGLVGFWVWPVPDRPLTRGRCLGVAVGIPASVPIFVLNGLRE